MLRSRQVLAKNGGKDCDGPFRQTEMCNSHPCPIKVDCVWTTWSRSGSCSKTCGGGYHLYVRTHLKKAENGGQICSGLSYKHEICNENSCPNSSNYFY